MTEIVNKNIGVVHHGVVHYGVVHYGVVHHGVVHHGVVHHGVVHHGVVHHGVVHHGVVHHGVVHYGVVHYGVVHYGVVHHGVVHHGVVHHGVVHYGVVHYGVVHYGVVHYGVVHHVHRIRHTPRWTPPEARSWTQPPPLPAAGYQSSCAPFWCVQQSPFLLLFVLLLPQPFAIPLLPDVSLHSLLPLEKEHLLKITDSMNVPLL